MANRKKTTTKKTQNKTSKKRTGEMGSITVSKFGFNKKTALLFIVPFLLIGAFILAFSKAADDPKLATVFPANSPYFQHPAPESEFKTDGGTNQVLANSVNSSGGYPQLLWKGPGATFTYHQNGDNKIQACFRVRDMGQALFGDNLAANVTFAINTDGGTKTLAKASPTLDWRYKDSTIYGYQPYCITSGELTDGTTYNNVEYTVTVNKGAINIQSLDIHGIDPSYAPTTSTTPTDSNGGNEEQNKNDNNEVSCMAIGCPTPTNKHKSTTTTSGTNPILDFSETPATKYNPAEVEAVVNYISAVECGKTPLMEWNDTTKKCVPMDFSFMTVLTKQVGDYIASLEQQAGTGGGKGGTCPEGYINTGSECTPPDTGTDLGFLDPLGYVCGVYSPCNTTGIDFCFLNNSCAGESVPTRTLYNCVYRGVIDSKYRRVYNDCEDSPAGNTVGNAYDCWSTGSTDYSEFICYMQ